MLVGGATGGGFETLRGDKTHCFITQNPKLNNYIKLTIHTLSFSLMFLTILSTHINTSWAHYLYTKLEYKNSNFQSVKAAVDRRLAAAAGGWRLVGGGWSVVGGCCLP